MLGRALGYTLRHALGCGLGHVCLDNAWIESCGQEEFFSGSSSVFKGVPIKRVVNGLVKGVVDGLIDKITGNYKGGCISRPSRSPLWFVCIQRWLRGCLGRLAPPLLLCERHGGDGRKQKVEIRVRDSMYGLIM